MNKVITICIDEGRLASHLTYLKSLLDQPQTLDSLLKQGFVLEVGGEQINTQPFKSREEIVSLVDKLEKNLRVFRAMLNRSLREK